MKFLIAFIAGFVIPTAVAVSAFAAEPKLGAGSKKQPGTISAIAPLNGSQGMIKGASRK